jgi:dienelactone hydrolase
MVCLVNNLIRLGLLGIFLFLFSYIRAFEFIYRNRACFFKLTTELASSTQLNLQEQKQHAVPKAFGSNRPLKNYFVQMKIIYLLLLLMVSAACGSDPAKKQMDAFAKRVPKGSVSGTIMCKADMAQSYALYLPSGYNTDNKYPVLFCFDPHGAGVLPVNLLREVAEKLGIVLVGSNNVQNGMQQDIVMQSINTMMGDVKANINTDQHRLYFVGFSGGARVSLAALAQYPDIRGVIACSGSVPAAYIPQQTYLAGIAGTDDMNYAEMVQMENGFSPDADRHIMLTFSGTHGWPPKAVISAAVQWLSIGEMKDHLVPVNNEIIGQFVSLQYNDSLTLSEKYRGCRQIVRTLSGLTDVSHYQQILANLEVDPNLQKEMVKERMMDSSEKAQQEIYSKAFNDQPIGWWRGEIARLNKAIKSENSKMDKALNRRLLAYISLYAYSATNYAKKSGNIPVLQRCIEIYGMADPVNPDYFYFLAGYNAFIGKKDQTVIALEKALQYGFDVQKIKNDAVILNLVGEEALQKLVEAQNPK